MLNLLLVLSDFKYVNIILDTAVFRHSNGPSIYEILRVTSYGIVASEEEQLPSISSVKNNNVARSRGIECIFA